MFMSAYIKAELEFGDNYCGFEIQKSTMKMLSIQFGTLIWVIHFVSFLRSDKSYVEPIKILLNELNQPLKITAMVCWSFDQKFQFTQNFFQHSTNNGIRDYQFAITDVRNDSFLEVKEEHQHLIILDFSCNNTKLLLNHVGLKITNRIKWIVLDTTDSSMFDQHITQTFQGLPVLPNSEIFCICKIAMNEFTIKQVYRTSMAKNLIIEYFGVVHNNKLYDYRKSRITARRRTNLNGVSLRASIVITNNETLNHLTDYRDKHIDTITKVNYILTTHLLAYVNATANYSIVSSWGYMDNITGKWDGMIGQLVENVTDIGASALFFTSDRIPYIEYIAMPSPTRSKFIFRSPKLSYTENVFLLPFNYFVWYCVIALIIVTALFLGLSTYAEWKVPLANSDINDSGTLRPVTLDVLLLVFGAACQQGSSVAPRSSTSRIIMLIIFLILMFLYTSYSANIVALLQSPSNKIKTLEDLLLSRLKFGADDTVFNRYYFSHATETVRRKIYDQKIVQKDGTINFMPLKDGVEKIREGLFAFHMELGVGYKLIGETFLEDEKCGLQEIQYLQVIDPWYAIQKNSSYKELLKTGMMRLHEHGIQDRENSLLYTKKPKCIGGGGKFVTASLVDTKAALLLLLWGYLVAFTLVIVENLIHQYCSRKTGRNT